MRKNCLHSRNASEDLGKTGFQAIPTGGARTLRVFTRNKIAMLMFLLGRHHRSAFTFIQPYHPDNVTQSLITMKTASRLSMKAKDSRFWFRPIPSDRICGTRLEQYAHQTSFIISGFSVAVMWVRSLSRHSYRLFTVGLCAQAGFFLPSCTTLWVIFRSDRAILFSLHHARPSVGTLIFAMLPDGLADDMARLCACRSFSSVTGGIITCVQCLGTPTRRIIIDIVCA